jgi:F420-dependent oxidoreductase-like protein
MSATGIFFNPRPDGISFGDMISVARHADQLGYDALWTGESWGMDAFSVLTAVACHTRSIRLGTGIVTVFSRTPSMIAQCIASLDLVSEGRAMLGLGTSGRAVIEDWHGLPFRYPLQRTREYIKIIRQALSGGPVNHEGRFFRVRRFRLGVSPVQKRIPIYLASLGPKNLQMTGELADGWLPIWSHQGHLAGLKEQVAKGAALAGRDISEITVSPQIMCHVADGAEDLADATRRIRAHMTYYIGGMGSYYYDLFSRYGYRAEADALREAWAAGDRAGAAASITDEMLDNIVIIGDAAACRAKLDQFRRSGSDVPMVAFPRGTSLPAMLRTLEALAPEGTSRTKPSQ